MIIKKMNTTVHINAQEKENYPQNEQKEGLKNSKKSYEIEIEPQQKKLNDIKIGSSQRSADNLLARLIRERERLRY